MITFESVQFLKNNVWVHFMFDPSLHFFPFLQFSAVCLQCIIFQLVVRYICEKDNPLWSWSRWRWGQSKNAWGHFKISWEAAYSYKAQRQRTSCHQGGDWFWWGGVREFSFFSCLFTIFQLFTNFQNSNSIHDIPGPIHNTMENR